MSAHRGLDPQELAEVRNAKEQLDGRLQDAEHRLKRRVEQIQDLEERCAVKP